MRSGCEKIYEFMGCSMNPVVVSATPTWRWAHSDCRVRRAIRTRTSTVGTVNGFRKRASELLEVHRITIRSINKKCGFYDDRWDRKGKGKVKVKAKAKAKMSWS
jgi:hypothetical protein